MTAAAFGAATLAVEAHGLLKRYGRRVVLDGISIGVRWGEIVGILGPNGAGKTTLLQLADTLMHPTAGTVTVLGETLGRTDVFEVRGHADPSEGGDRGALALARASAVKEFLVKNGADAKRLVVRSYGDTVPIAGATPQGKARNRRVDFEAPGKRRT